MKQILKDRVLVKRIQVENKNSILDIIEDDNAPLTGQVVLVGKLVEDVKLKDIVKYKDGDAFPININGKNMFILREYDIIGIV
jgi:co-chaperonin GroES (HSP10)